MPGVQLTAGETASTGSTDSTFLLPRPSFTSNCCDQWDLSRNGAGHFQAVYKSRHTGLSLFSQRETTEGSHKMADSLYQSQSYKV